MTSSIYSSLPVATAWSPCFQLPFAKPGEGICASMQKLHPTTR